MTAEEIKMQIELLQPKAGDIIHVKLGGYLGEDLSPWIPTPEDFMLCQDMWEKAGIPEGVRVIIGHFLENATVEKASNNE